MDIAQVHPEYAEKYDDWRMVYDSLNERRVKSRGVTYLPRTSGQNAVMTESNDAPYISYKLRARFPMLTNAAITALVGIAHRMPSELDAEDRFKKLTNSITPNGEGLEELQRNVVRHVLTSGRYGLLSDVDNKGNPYIAGYDALSIKDWRTSIIDGRQVLSYLKLQESVDKSEDISKREIRQQYRVLRLKDGFYVCEVYNDSGAMIDNAEATKATKERLDYIPFVIIGAQDLGFECDEPPMLPLARTAVSIYQLDADYRQSLHMTAEPTPVISGHEGELPTSIGSATMWSIPEGAKAFYLEVSGVGIEAQKSEIEAEYKRAEKIAGELSQEGSGQESGEALKLRLFSRHASLFSVVKSSGSGIERALNSCSDMVGTGKVTFKPNLDFTSKEVSDQLITAFSNGVMSATIPQSVLNQALRDSGRTDLDDEQIAVEIENGVDSSNEPIGS